MKLCKNYFFVLICLWSCQLSMFAQQNNSATKWDTFVDDVGIGFNDAGAYFLSPIQIPSAQSSIILGATSIGIASSIAYMDIPARNFFLRNQTPLADNIFSVTNTIGEIYTPIALSVSLYGIGLFFEEPTTRITGRLLAESFLFSGITTSLGKSFFGRSRPFVNGDNTDFQFFQLNEPNLSFPSGHSTVAFSIASVLSYRIDNIYASVGLYSLASATAAARMYKDKHWFSDVLLGSVIGTASGIYVCSREEDRHSKKTQQSSLQWNLIPTLNGLSFIMNW